MQPAVSARVPQYGRQQFPAHVVPGDVLGVIAAERVVVPNQQRSCFLQDVPANYTCDTLATDHVVEFDEQLRVVEQPER